MDVEPQQDYIDLHSLIESLNADDSTIHLMLDQEFVKKNFTLVKDITSFAQKLVREFQNVFWKTAQLYKEKGLMQEKLENWMRKNNFDKPRLFFLHGIQASKLLQRLGYMSLKDGFEDRLLFMYNLPRPMNAFYHKRHLHNNPFSQPPEEIRFAIETQAELEAFINSEGADDYYPELYTYEDELDELNTVGYNGQDEDGEGEEDAPSSSRRYELSQNVEPTHRTVIEWGELYKQTLEAFYKELGAAVAESEITFRRLNPVAVHGKYYYLFDVDKRKNSFEEPEYEEEAPDEYIAPEVLKKIKVKL